MSRLTGKEVYSLMEAYQQVYAPKELTEEQVWEEVEYWVNSLLEEGYDLSDYTWEEMYEEYLSEAGFFQGAGAGADKFISGAQKKVQGAVSGAIKTGQAIAGGAQRAGTAIAGAAKKDIEGKIKTGQAIVGGVQRAGTAIAGAAKKDIEGKVQGAIKTGQAIAGGAQRAGSAVAGAAGAAGRKIGQEIEISRKVGAGEPPTTSAKVSSSTPKPAPSSQYTSKNLGGAQYGAFKSGGGDAAIRKGSSAGEVVAQGRKNISKVVSGREMNVTAPGVVKSGFDMFDVVLGHLIDEGYADTYETALIIMGNMSEDWKYSIIENSLTRN
jgi:hypothetical protein